MASPVTIFFLATFFAVGAAALDDQKIPVERQQELADFVVQDCGSCHGLTFKGGLGSAFTKEKLEETPEQVLFEVIEKGIEGTPMPAWGPLLKPEEIKWIINYLKRVSPDE